MYELNEDDSITCLGGRRGYIVNIPERNPKYKNTIFLLVKDCIGFQFMSYCRQFMKEPMGTEKVFEINRAVQKQKQKTRDLLLSTEGIELRVNRNGQYEGSFGVLK